MRRERYRPLENPYVVIRLYLSPDEPTRLLREPPAYEVSI